MGMLHHRPPQPSAEGPASTSPRARHQTLNNPQTSHPGGDVTPQDLKKKPKLREKYGVLDEWVMPYEVIPIIDIPGFGDKSAQVREGGGGWGWGGGVLDEWVMPYEVIPIIDIPGFGDKSAQARGSACVGWGAAGARAVRCFRGRRRVVGAL